jgi:hypothetical protein
MSTDDLCITGEAGAENGRLIEQIVRQLNAVCKSATFEFALSIGKVVIDNVYAGNLLAWRDRGPKNASFRKLAKHPELPMSPSALYRCVAIYELSDRLAIDPRGRLSSSHLRLVLPLSQEVQERLLRRADAEAWSVARLGEETPHAHRR